MRPLDNAEQAVLMHLYNVLGDAQLPVVGCTLCEQAMRLLRELAEGHR